MIKYSAYILKLTAIMLPFVLFFAPQSASAQNCAMVSKPRSGISAANIKLYGPKDGKIALLKTINKNDLPKILSLRDCAGVKFFGFVYKGQSYLIRRIDLTSICDCTPPRRNQAGNAGSGAVRQCPQSQCS